MRSKHVKVVEDPQRSILLGLAGVDASYVVLRRRGASYVLRSEYVDRTLARCTEQRAVPFDVTHLIRIAECIVDPEGRVAKHRKSETHPGASLKDLR